MAQAVTGSFTATGQSASFLAKGIDDGRPKSFNVELRGNGVATIQLERSFDGTNWAPLTASGTQLERFTMTGSSSYSETWEEEEAGALYRLNCTAYTSGTVNYRLSN